MNGDDDRLFGVSDLNEKKNVSDAILKRDKLKNGKGLGGLLRAGKREAFFWRGFEKKFGVLKVGRKLWNSKKNERTISTNSQSEFR